MPSVGATRMRAALAYGALVALAWSTPAHAETSAAPAGGDAALNGNNGTDTSTQANYLTRLIKALAQDESYKVRLQAAVLLGRSGSSEAVDPLLAALSQDSESAVRLAAASALAALHDPRVIAPLVQRQALDTDSTVRDGATHALSAFPRSQALPYVMAAYGSDEAAVRKQVLLYISTEPSPLLEPVLSRALGDVPEVFEPAAAAFHALPNDDAMRILVAAAAHRDPAVRRGAVVVLRQMQSPAAAMAIREVYERDVEVDEVREATRRALRDLRRFLPIDPILQAAANADRHVRARALKLLGVLGGAQAQDALLKALKADDTYIRGTAVWAMSDLGSADVIPVLEQMTHEPANERILPLVRHTLKTLREQQHDTTKNDRTP